MWSIAELGALGMAIFVAAIISLKFLIGLIHKPQASAAATEPIAPDIVAPLPGIGVASPIQRRQDA